MVIVIITDLYGWLLFHKGWYGWRSILLNVVLFGTVRLISGNEDFNSMVKTARSMFTRPDDQLITLFYVYHFIWMMRIVYYCCLCLYRSFLS